MKICNPWFSTTHSQLLFEISQPILLPRTQGILRDGRRQLLQEQFIFVFWQHSASLALAWLRLRSGTDGLSVMS